VVYPSGPEQPPAAVHTVRVPSLPFISLVWISENAIVAAGHDYEPILFTGSATAGWTISKSLDDPSSRSHAPSGHRVVSAGGIGRLNNEAFNRFKAADSRGITSSAAGQSFGASNINKGGERNTAHQNTITSLRVYEGGEGRDVTKISSSGLDGRIGIWNTASLADEVAKLSLK
jgi:actin related protein 2/3 complex subunit 1A/1B